MKRSSEGFALPLSLFIITVLLLLTSVAARTTDGVINIAQRAIHGEYLFAAGFEDTLAHVRSQNSDTPVVLFNLLYSSGLDCPLTFSEKERSNGLSLSTGSIRSIYTCRALRAFNTPIGTYHGNLDFRGVGGYPQPAILAVRGYVVLERLSLTGDILMVAGGDLIINRIESDRPIQIKLISVTGRVALGNLPSSAKLEVSDRFNGVRPAELLPGELLQKIKVVGYRNGNLQPLPQKESNLRSSGK